MDAGSLRLNLVTASVYDAVGNLRSVDGPRADVVDQHSHMYDNELRLVQSTDALGKLSKIAYDADGRPVRAAAQVGLKWLVSCKRYSPSGKALRSWGPALTAADTACPAEAAPVPVTDYAYDELDRPLRATEYLPAAEGGNRIGETDYFADGSVKAVRRGVGTASAHAQTCASYTANGRLRRWPTPKTT